MGVMVAMTHSKRNTRFLLVDILYLTIVALPLLGAIVLKVLTNVPSDGIAITGARIYFRIPMPLQDLIISEAQVNSVGTARKCEQRTPE